MLLYVYLTLLLTPAREEGSFDPEAVGLMGLVSPSFSLSLI